jgi:hypothetical protein
MPIDFYITIVHRVIIFLTERERLIQSVLKSECFPSLLRILSEQVEFDILQKLKENAEKGYRLIADPEVMARFFTGAILETLQWWLTHKK